LKGHGQEIFWVTTELSLVIAMFKDEFLGKSGFRSKHVAPRTDGSNSARPVPCNDGEAQTDGTRADGESQTDASTTTTASSAKGKAGASAAEIEAENVEKTRAFLETVGPVMLREMSKSAAQSGLFFGFEKYLEASSDTDIAKLHTLCFDFDTYFRPQAPAVVVTTAKVTQGRNATKPMAREADDDDDEGLDSATKSLKLSCTGVSWNATGAVVGVAYGRFDHSGWCNYRSALCLWRVFQPDFNAASPHTVLETSVSSSLELCWGPVP
jgi:hypothetical protein